MAGKNSFLDSNICVYAFDESVKHKQEKALELFGSKPCISSQVLIETYNVCHKKLKFTKTDCEENTLYLSHVCIIVPIDTNIILKSVEIARKYQFSFLDAVIVASALAANCTTLFTEDMQHNQVIENKLIICNPFV